MAPWFQTVALAAGLFLDPAALPAPGAVPSELERCSLTDSLPVDLRGDGRPYVAEERACAGAGLDHLQNVIALREPSGEVAWALAAAAGAGAASLEVVLLPGGREALLVGAWLDAHGPSYGVLALSGGRVRVLDPPREVHAPLEPGEHLAPGTVEAVAGGLLLEAPVGAPGDPDCCASRGRVLAMLSVEPGRGRVAVLGVRREP